MHELSRQQARRIAVTAQLLAHPRPTDLLTVVRHLGAVQVDLTKRVAPSPHLVLHSRLGTAYRLDDLDRALDERALIELNGVFRPAEDIALFRADMAAWPADGERFGWQRSNARWLETNDNCRRDILRILGSEGPLPASELPDTCLEPWKSTGWTNDKNVVRMLDFMAARGEVAVSHRDGGARHWDLAERVYPDTPVVPAAEAEAERDRRRLRSLGIGRARGPECPAESIDVGDAGEPAVVEGVKGTWRVDPDLLDQPFRGRAALLSPIDRLLFDRRRMSEIFEFDYALEMYKPAAKRRWGYYALPVLYGDRLVGKLDCTADHPAGQLRVHALHQDVELSATAREAIEREIRSLATLLGLEVAS